MLYIESERHFTDSDNTLYVYNDWSNNKKTVTL